MCTRAGGLAISAGEVGETTRIFRKEVVLSCVDFISFVSCGGERLGFEDGCGAVCLFLLLLFICTTTIVWNIMCWTRDCHSLPSSKGLSHITHFYPLFKGDSNDSMTVKKS